VSQFLYEAHNKFKHVRRPIYETYKKLSDR